MSVSVTLKGDFAKLAALVRKFKRADELSRQIVKALGAEALAQVQLGFREERDPDGKPWAPLKRRVGRILSKTGRLRRSFSMKFHASGFRIGTNVKYAKHHQFGAPRANIPPRRMLPSNGSIGKAWAAPVRKTVQQILLRYWGKR